MCCFPWLSALSVCLGWHSADISSPPLPQELQNDVLTGTDHRYRRLESKPQLSTVPFIRGSVTSIEVLEPNPSTPPLPSQHLIGTTIPASEFKPLSVSSDYPEITAQIHEPTPQVPAAAVKGSHISSVKAPASMSSASSLPSDHQKIIVRSISYPECKLQNAEIAYTIDRRESWHWLPYERLVEKWGKDGIRKFDPKFKDGL